MRHAKLHDPKTPESRPNVVNGFGPIQGDQEHLESFPQPQETLPRCRHPSSTISEFSDWQDQTLTATSQESANDVATGQVADEGDHQVVNHLQDAYFPVPADLDTSSMPYPDNPFTVPGTAVDEVSPLYGNNIWGASLMSPGPFWLFDLDALNTSVSATIDIPQPLFQHHTELQVAAPVLEDQPAAAADAQPKRKSTDHIRRGWFSRINRDEDNEDIRGGNHTAQLTPTCTADQYDIGDNYRSRITARLKAPTNDEPLPSTKFLVSCNVLYLSRITIVMLQKK